MVLPKQTYESETFQALILRELDDIDKLSELLAQKGTHIRQLLGLKDQLVLPFMEKPSRAPEEPTDS